MWELQGFNSPYFLKWSGGKQPSDVPSWRELPNKRARGMRKGPKGPTRDNMTSGWTDSVFSPLSEKYRGAHQILKDQAPDPSKLTYLDQVALTPDVWTMYHSTMGKGFTQNAIDFRKTQVGFHVGTMMAAQERASAVAKAGSGFKALPPPLVKPKMPTPRYENERVFVQKFNKLLPMDDLGLWGTQEVLTNAIANADRIGEKALAKDLKDYFEAAKTAWTKETGVSADEVGLMGMFHRPEKHRGKIDLNDFMERPAVIENVRNILRKNGFDGILYENNVEAKGSLSVISITDGSLKLVAEAPDALGKPTGQFKPSSLYGLGAAVPVAAAARAASQGEVEDDS